MDEQEVQRPCQQFLSDSAPAFTRSLGLMIQPLSESWPREFSTCLVDIDLDGNGVLSQEELARYDTSLCTTTSLFLVPSTSDLICGKLGTHGNVELW